MRKQTKIKLGIAILLGILILVLIFNPKREGFTDAEPTFHILIATGGRQTLQRMLNSLKGELKEEDAVTVIFDGRERFQKSGYSDAWIEGFRCKVNVIVHEENLGYWGHPIRNKHMSMLSPKTTFIMNADDDDAYYPGSFDTLRATCKNPETLYIAKMNYDDDESKVVPKQNKEIVEADIGTPNGIIPFNKAPLGHWENNSTGDFKYYKSLIQHITDIQFLDTVIYRVY